MLAGLDLQALSGPLGIAHHRFVIDVEEFPESAVEWLSSEGAEVVLELLDAMFRSLRNHLNRLNEAGLQGGRGVDLDRGRGGGKNGNT